jgi:hypothetical protein
MGARSKGIEGNNISYLMARMRSEHPFRGPALAHDISVRCSKKAARD